MVNENSNVILGELNVNYMNARYRFGWDAVHFGLFFSIVVVLEVFGCILGVLIISKVLQLDDTILGVVGFTCSVLANLLFALAPNEQYFYVALR
ncbi:hypothetical protein WA026_022681 [Henosepilachna vigintioctopunctata]|uniref:Uncharacterized protein n=1 Tax=Henosepilachna vigintioctopunctata TaxID=420089 RepID=A0AAW1TXX6_9CUCU